MANMTRMSALVPKEPKAGGTYRRYEGEEDCWAVRGWAQEGMFPEEWCAHFGITMSTLYNWANAHPEFEQACMEAWYLLRAFWTKKARDATQRASDIPPSVLKTILERRFPDTWGKNPRNTQETFETRPGRPSEDEALPEDQTPEAVRAMDSDTLAKRIAALQARREHDPERKE
jgi:hypothetical protein